MLISHLSIKLYKLFIKNFSTLSALETNNLLAVEQLHKDVKQHLVFKSDLYLRNKTDLYKYTFNSKKYKTNTYYDVIDKFCNYLFNLKGIPITEETRRTLHTTLIERCIDHTYGIYKGDSVFNLTFVDTPIVKIDIEFTINTFNYDFY